MGCGCGMTCWNHLRDWQAAGVWDQIHQILLDHLRHADRIDFERFIVDTGHVRAVGGVKKRVPVPLIARNWAANTRFSPMVRRASGHRHHPGEHSGRQSSRAVGRCGPSHRW